MANDLTKSRAFFVKKRWGGRRICPNCNNRALSRLGARYQCRRCRFRFADFTNTYLGRLRIPLHTTSHLAYLFILGVPAYRIRFYEDVSLRTIERTFMLFRQAIYDTSPKLVFDGEVELDEAMFGGHRKGKRGWGAAGKTVVFGIRSRNGQIIAFPVPDRKQKTLKAIIEKHTKPGSLYYTDEYTAYGTLDELGRHEVVTHSKDEYVRDDVHINGLEGFWSFAKNFLYAYRGVPRKYFPLYLKYIEFRYNHRDENMFELLADILVKEISKVESSTQVIPDPLHEKII